MRNSNPSQWMPQIVGGIVAPRKKRSGRELPGAFLYQALSTTWLEATRKDSNAIISMPQIAPANPSISSDFHVLPVALGLFMW
jgi:hypothetical protein